MQDRGGANLYLNILITICIRLLFKYFIIKLANLNLNIIVTIQLQQQYRLNFYLILYIPNQLQSNMIKLISIREVQQKSKKTNTLISILDTNLNNVITTLDKKYSLKKTLDKNIKLIG